ncbi:MAG: C45 family autoproteolytic acyltransferase/hydrolase [Bacteroidota bacterium]|nr:C45 family autoproteolytic acyltransferase/hydrolase [Bacteroidota bacterium]
MILSLNCAKEDSPGEKWKAMFYKTWPSYKQWFLSEGMMARKGYLTSANMLQHYMPELAPVYEKLIALAGGGDLEARFLSMYCPPPYMSGCSQMAWNRNETFLIRNYDYSPALFEGNMLRSQWLKPVIGISDCNWGLLDGINADGLAASLAFGGRNTIGEGFGIPIVIRYILETCISTTEAVKKLACIPTHMSYNVTVIDASGEYATVYLAPDKPPVVLSSPIATNQQEEIDWHYYAAITATQERKNLLGYINNLPNENEESVTYKFLQPPLYNYNYQKNFGTLYTAVYNVSEKNVSIFWPGDQKLTQTFDEYHEENIMIHLLPGKIKKNIYK